MRYTSLDEYLARLPLGLRSYPTAKLKSAVFQEFGEGLPLGDDLSGLPPEIAAVVATPPPPSTWVPAVIYYGSMLARVEYNKLDEAQYLEVTKRQTQKLFARPTYRLLVMVASPGILLRGAANRFGMFHDGIALSARSRGDREWELVMAFPAHLVPPLLVLGYGMTFATAIECGGASNVKYELLGSSPTQATYRVTWDR